MPSFRLSRNLDKRGNFPPRLLFHRAHSVSQKMQIIFTAGFTLLHSKKSMLPKVRAPKHFFLTSVNHTGSCPTFIHRLMMNQASSYMKNGALACSSFSTSFSVIIDFSSLCVGTYSPLSLTSLLISKEHAYRVTAWVYACVCQRPKPPADTQISTK